MGVTSLGERRRGPPDNHQTKSEGAVRASNNRRIKGLEKAAVEPAHGTHDSGRKPAINQEKIL